MATARYIQLQEHFHPELLIQKEDLEWTKAMRVTLPYDEVFEIRPGLTLYHTGGHYDGHSILYDRDRKAVFAGDSLKIDFDPDGSAQRISCHKAYHKQIPLSRDEARRYRAVYEQLDFTTVFTPFEYATNTSTKAALGAVGRGDRRAALHHPDPDPAMSQHFLPPDIPDAAAAYIESMPPGRVELFSLAPLDRTGVACWNAIFLNEDGTRFHGVTPHGVGYGTTDAEAIVGTTGELAEAVHSAGAIARFPRRTGSYAALAAELGARGIADPLTSDLPAGSPVDHDTVMEWVPAQRWPGGESGAGADGDRRAARWGIFHAGLPAVHHPDHQRARRRADAGFRHRPRHLRVAAAGRQRHRVPRHGPRHRAGPRRRPGRPAHPGVAGPAGGR